MMNVVMDMMIPKERERRWRRWGAVVVLFCGGCRFEESVCVLLLASRLGCAVLCVFVLFSAFRFWQREREKSLTNLFLGRREKERFCFRWFFFGLKFRERESKLRRQEFVLLYKENKKISWTKEKETVFLFILCFYCRYSERINECFLSNRETGAKSWYGA